MQEAIKSIPTKEHVKNSFKAGWAKVNITPSEKISLAGYGLRDEFDQVHDSIWCRAYVFDNGKKRTAVVTVDLLIFPPTVVKLLKGKLPAVGLTIENTFLSATHTHNAPGGWAEKTGGRVLAGKYNEKYVSQLAEAVILSIQKASENMEEASIGFGKFEAKKFLKNRLNKDAASVDHWLRVIKVQKKSGTTGLIVTYAAHPNILSSKINHISGDYAGEFVEQLEKTKHVDFAAFCAGAVGMHTCNDFKKENYELIKFVSTGLSEIVMNNMKYIELKDSIDIENIYLPVYLRDPQFKISEDWKVRPWVFRALLGEEDVAVTALKLGDVVLIGTPCDFSGELVKEFSKVSSQQKVNLVITSFNGGYIGYIIPDKYYDLPRREPRDMDWYGPYSGSYFTEIIKGLLQKI